MVDGMEEEVVEEVHESAAATERALNELDKKHQQDIRGPHYDDSERINVISKKEQRAERKTRGSMLLAKIELAKFTEELKEKAVVISKAGGQQLVAYEKKNGDAASVASSMASFQRGGKKAIRLQPLDGLPEMPIFDFGDDDYELDEEEVEKKRKVAMEAFELKISREKKTLLNAPTSLDFAKLQRILTAVQDEVSSKLEQHEQTLRDYFAVWNPILQKVYKLNKEIDESKTVTVMNDFLAERKLHFELVVKAKKRYLKQMDKIKGAALESEDFSIVYIADREIRYTKDRKSQYLYRTYREHVIYHLTRIIVLTFQYLISFVYATLIYVP